MQVSRPGARPQSKTPVARERRLSSFAKLFRRFFKDRRGSTTIEFVALALPFALLVFAILESCLSFAGQQVLANATDDIARQFRTGYLRPNMIDEVTKEPIKVDETYLKQKICDRLAMIAPGDCMSNLKVDLRQFNTFKQAAEERFQITEGEIDTDCCKVDPGLSGTKNMLRVFYAWPVITDLMRLSMSNLSGGRTLHFATATWQNEPFDD